MCVASNFSGEKKIPQRNVCFGKLSVAYLEVTHREKVGWFAAWSLGILPPCADIFGVNGWKILT